MVLLYVSVLAGSSILNAEQIPVRQKEGVVHGFLVLRTLQDQKIADGELTQITEGDRVTSHLIFHFKDGSLYDDKTIFRQDGSFRLVSDHLVEQGPSFKNSSDTVIDASSGEITEHYKDHGKDKVLKQHLNLPPDVCNGMLFTLVKDIQPSAPETTLTMVATTPKPRLVKLLIAPAGKETVGTGQIKDKANLYVMKIKIGGFAGLVAPILGKQPADTKFWVLDGSAPAFVKSEGPLYDGGPVWRTELAVPTGS
jgi:hypothetical protein